MCGVAPDGGEVQLIIREARKGLALQRNCLSCPAELCSSPTEEQHDTWPACHPLVPHSVPLGPLHPSQDFLKAPLGCCSVLSLQKGKRGWVLGVNPTDCSFSPSNVKIPL